MKEVEARRSVDAHTDTHAKAKAKQSDAHPNDGTESESESDAVQTKRRREIVYTKEEKMEAILRWLGETDDGRYSDDPDIAAIRSAPNKRAVMPVGKLIRWVGIVSEMADLDRTDNTADPAGRGKLVTNEIVGKFLGRSADWVKSCADVQRLLDNKKTREKVQEVLDNIQETPMGINKLLTELRGA